MPERSHNGWTTLFGRTGVLRVALDRLGSPARSPLVAITGPAGIGRTAMLAEVARVMAGRDRSVLSVRLSPTDGALPGTLSVRLLNELIGSGGGRYLAGLIAAAGSGPPGARRAAGALATLLAEQAPVLVVLDDAQWIDTDSLAVLDALVRQLAAGPAREISWLVAIRSPAAAGVSDGALPVLERLAQDGLATSIFLHPLTADELTALTAQTLQAVPDPALVAALVRTTRGVPAALLAAIEGHRRSDSVRVADRHAYLVRPHDAPTVPRDHNLFGPIHQLPAPAWAVAKAIAVLHPLGPAATALVAEATGHTVEQTETTLSALAAEGVLGREIGRDGWRFRVPVLAAALTSCLGPYERRQLAQAAVTALWTGRADCPDPGYLADQLANAGKLVDPDRARAELLARAGATMLDDGHRAARWLRAAAELTTDHRTLGNILFLHAATCCIHGDFAASAASSTVLLREHADEFDPDMLLELELVHVTSLRGMGDVATLARLVDTEWRQLPGQPAQRIVTAAAALSLLNRWPAAYRLLLSTRDSWHTATVSADLGSIFLAGSGLWLGRPAHFEQYLAEPGRWRLNTVDRHHLERVLAETRMLLVAGDLQRAQALLVAEQVPEDRLPASDRAMLSAARGDWPAAMDLARSSIAAGMAPGYEPGHVAMHHVAASILWAYGQPTRARTLLHTARAAGPVLPHLLDAAEGAMDMILGAPGVADDRLRHGISVAREQDLVLGTEVLWFQLAELAVQARDAPTARACLAELDRVCAAMGGGRPALHAMIIRAVLDEDAELAWVAVALARDRDQPFELAYTIDLLVRHGVGDPALLPEAYQLFGSLGARLYRAWLRNLMRSHDIAVPGRQATVAENERLLAELVTEGLSNRQLATVLQTSEKSVEGRLSRLFARTGYQSRVELAAAMLTGEY
ncbi:MAG TPA: AAA family ATPase [Pseudonocardiaceae bacterium]|jgi:DNA-binding NarL/FixJ family response regulator|nr:AAA family ATPase [Pseudonocardiaceae bacterium]